MGDFTPVAVALVFHGLDFLSGFIAAIKAKDIQSAKMRDGLFKKIGFLFCYFLAWMLDKFGPAIGLQLGIAVLPIIVLYAVSTEAVSIIENISKINPDLLPEKLKDMFHLM